MGWTSWASSIVQCTVSPGRSVSVGGRKRSTETGVVATFPHEIDAWVTGSWTFTYHEFAGMTGGCFVTLQSKSVVAVALPDESDFRSASGTMMSLAAPFGGLPIPHWPL